MGLLLLLIDGVLVSLIANRLLGFLGAAGHAVARTMQILTASVLVIIASVWALSAVGFLEMRGFLALHAVLAVVLLLATGRARGEGGPRPMPFRVLFPRGLACSIMGWLILILLGYALVLALVSFPGTYDSQTYRLSRVGYWLQEHRMVMHFGDDQRLYYMPYYTEFVMLWLAGFFPAGYPLVNLPGFLGGILCLLAVLELGRLAGLTKPGRLVAVVLLLGLPNVFMQFSTSQSDLFMAGFLSVGLAFAWRYLADRTKQDVVWAGIAFGIAIGAKSTFLYWLPGMALWFGLLCLLYRSVRHLCLKALLAVSLIALAIGGWKYADNLARFGNPFAPKAEIEHIHQHGENRLETIRCVAELHAWQLLQPNSNPRFAAPLLRPAARWLGDYIEASNPPNLVAEFRDIRATYKDEYVYEDIVSFGILVPILAAIAVVADLFASRRKASPDRLRRLAMASSLAFFFAFFFTQQNPNPWNYRFFIMLAPFLSVLAAAALPIRPFGPKLCTFALALAGIQAYGAFDIQSRNILGGWRGLRHPDQIGTVALFKTLAGQVHDLPPSAKSVAVALPVDRWLAPYFRQGDGRRISIVSLEYLRANFRSPADYLKSMGFDAVIVPPEAFGDARWPGVERNQNGLSGRFARVSFVRD